MNATTRRRVYFVMAMALIAGVCLADPDNEPVATATTENSPAIQASSNNSTPSPAAAPVATLAPAPAPTAKKPPGLIVKITSISAARDVSQWKQQIADDQALSRNIRNHAVPEADWNRVWVYWQSRYGSADRTDAKTRIQALDAEHEHLDTEISDLQHKIENASMQRAIVGFTDEGQMVQIYANNPVGAAQADSLVVGGKYQIVGITSNTGNAIHVILEGANPLDTPAPAGAPQSATGDPQAGNLAPAVGENPGGEPAPTMPGGTINLLAQVHLHNDVITGHWKPLRGGLYVGNGGGRLQLQYSPNGEYDFHVAFKRKQSDRPVYVCMAYNGKSFDWMMGARSGFGMVDGKPSDDVNNPTSINASIVTEEKYDVVVKVRKNFVSAWVDGKLWKDFPTDYSNLSANSRRRIRAGSLGLSCGGPTVFYAADVTQVSGGE